MKIILLVIFILFGFKMSVAQTEASALIGALNRSAIEIKSFTGEEYSDLEYLGNIVKEKKLIGLGEGTHGTSVLTPK